jgi:hypothetical protein
MKIGQSEQFLFAPSEPTLPRLRLALWAMAITGVPSMFDSSKVKVLFTT